MKQTNRLLLSMALVSCGAGILDARTAGVVGKPSPFAVIYAFALAVLVYRWCRAYAAERGIEPPFGASVLAAFLLPVGIPLYFFRLLPVLAACWATLKAVGFALATACLYSVTLLAAQRVAG